MDKNNRIFVAGHNGLVGSSIVRELRRVGYHNLILRDRSQLDLCRQSDVERFFEEQRPEYVFLAAAKVG
jgi:GDP-L-fucose synthase